MRERISILKNNIEKKFNKNKNDKNKEIREPPAQLRAYSPWLADFSATASSDAFIEMPGTSIKLS